jgi:hypothetical protein
MLFNKKKTLIMDFQEFYSMSLLIQAKLPAFDAHVKMAPLERLDVEKRKHS